MWQPISTAPYDRNLELAVIDHGGEHVLVFPCSSGRSFRVRAPSVNDWNRVTRRQRENLRAAVP